MFWNESLPRPPEGVFNRAFQSICDLLFPAPQSFHVNSGTSREPICCGIKAEPKQVGMELRERERWGKIMCLIEIVGQNSTHRGLPSSFSPGCPRTEQSSQPHLSMTFLLRKKHTVAALTLTDAGSITASFVIRWFFSTDSQIKTPV